MRGVPALLLAISGCLGGGDPPDERVAGAALVDEITLHQAEITFDGRTQLDSTGQVPVGAARVRVELTMPPGVARARLLGMPPPWALPGERAEWERSSCVTEQRDGAERCEIAPAPGGFYQLSIQWLSPTDASGRPAHGTVLVAASAEPRVMREDRDTVHFRPFPGQLFVRRHRERWDQGPEGIAARDVLQGPSADCYFLSGAAAVAEVQPDLLRRAITEDGEGWYTVRFYRPFVQPPELLEIHVSNLLPIRDGTNLPAYVRSPDPVDGDPWELWPMVLEKAYAKFKGGYDAIGHGGDMAEALALTGYPIEVIPLNGAPPAELHARLHDLEERGAFMLANTYPLATGAGTDRPDAQHQREGIAPWHVYTVLSATLDRNGAPQVLLRNPWGFFEPGQEQGNGFFQFPFDQFVARYRTVVAAVPNR